MANGEVIAKPNSSSPLNIGSTGVNEAVKSALKNGSVSEVVVKKDLLLYPLNVPNLVCNLHR